jgi:hypothetical protein
MQFIKRFTVGMLTVLTFATFNLAAAQDGPELPPQCGMIAAPAEATLAFNLYAIGVQVYRWNGAGWDFVEPDAKLYADVKYRGQVATHYVGPKWESNSGGWVLAKRADGCDVDPANNIQWLLLDTVTTEGPGPFSKVTHIQRVNTIGGVKPMAAGTTVGETKRVPYTAEYYFYR